MITPDAISNLIELKEYIANILLAPDIARNYIQHIRQEVSTLEQMPNRHILVQEGPWRSRGVRRMNVKNFIIYYRVDEAQMQVYILNVIYNKRDQLRALSKS
ncbi:MAG: type II toxin-antitoxin system RelE/ParE family toxin [Fretibacterium sp.]|nr:type II toxin-antitoxin system RelE/ParE family toxin [Fretibacterium sp.]